MQRFRLSFTLLQTIPVLFFLALIGFIAFPSCKHEPLVDPSGPNDTIPSDPGTGTPCSADTVYFQNTILPILVSNCTQSGCHNAQDHKEGIDVTSYEKLLSTIEKVTSTNWSNNELIEVITTTDAGDRMPRPPAPPLSADQVNLIKKWIQQGAQNNSCNESYDNCDTLNLTYNNYVKGLMSQRCTGCHGASNPQGGVNLTTFAQVKSYAQNGKLYSSLVRTSSWMPLNGQKLSTCNLSKIKAWINAGTPE